MPRTTPVFPKEVKEAYRIGKGLLTPAQGKHNHELIPGSCKSKDCNRCKAGSCQGQHYFKKGRQMARPIYPCGLQKLPGHNRKIAHHEPGAEGSNKHN